MPPWHQWEAVTLQEELMQSLVEVQGDPKSSHQSFGSSNRLLDHRGLASLPIQAEVHHPQVVENGTEVETQPARW